MAGFVAAGGVWLGSVCPGVVRLARNGTHRSVEVWQGMARQGRFGQVW